MDDQDIGQSPEGDLLGGVLLLLATVRTEPGVLAIQLPEGERGRKKERERRREGGR